MQLDSVDGEAVPGYLNTLIHEVQYSLSNNSFTAMCGKNTRSIEGPFTACMRGTFVEDDFLTFDIHRDDDSPPTKLKTVDHEWFFQQADDAPSFILKRIASNPNDDDGVRRDDDVVMRTAVTKPGTCTLLKVCMAHVSSGISQLPLGLVLLRHNDYSKTCTIPNSN